MGPLSMSREAAAFWILEWSAALRAESPRGF